MPSRTHTGTHFYKKVRYSSSASFLLFWRTGKADRYRLGSRFGENSNGVTIVQANSDQPTVIDGGRMSRGQQRTYYRTRTILAQGQCGKKIMGNPLRQRSKRGEVGHFRFVDRPGRKRSCTPLLGQIKSGQELVTLIDCFPTSTQNWWFARDGQTDWSQSNIPGKPSSERDRVRARRRSSLRTS